jgi:methyl-accepting chemotaxis protein
MKTSGKLGNRTLFASGSIILFLLVIGGITERMLKNQKQITAAQERRYQSFLLADELRQSSDDLTRLARTYVVTADPRYEEQYWAVLDIRNGKSPRPINYERIYWDFMAADGVKPRGDDKAVPLQQLMKEQGFTEAEFVKLKEAQANSDGLVKIETIAMNAVKGLFDDGRGNYTKKGEPNLELARQLMHSKDYHLEKAKIMKPIDEFFSMLDRRTGGEVQVLVQRSYRLFYALLTAVGLAILTLTGLCISIFSTVVKPIKRVMGELSNTSHELDAASAQLARSSQTLSSGASEQASSVEETSTSLEEMSSMIQATAENAQKAKTLASETRVVAESGSRTMIEMVEAMAEIDSSSAQVAKIVKNIDEIAFQTNILALNAAVEAARAGEAGAGFAVVADEVRSLAQRSAAAAKETADKIEAAIASSRKGSQCTARVGDSLTQISAKVTATDLLVGEIATAAREQAQGIEQINQALGQMDKVSQSNASNAEESASAAEQVDTQGEVLNELVGRLRQLVGGDSIADSPVESSEQSSRPRPTVVFYAQQGSEKSVRQSRDEPTQIRSSQRKELPPGDPGDDGDFRNF